MPKTRLRIPDLPYAFEENASYVYVNDENEKVRQPYEYYDAGNNRELQDAIKRTRRRIKEALGDIVRMKAGFPQSTMDALYKLDRQLGMLNQELKLGNEKQIAETIEIPMQAPDASMKLEVEQLNQFEFTDGIDGYLAQMDTLEKMGEILNDHTVAPNGEKGTTVFDYLSTGDVEQAKKDIEILQRNLFIQGTDLLDEKAYAGYSELYGPKKEGREDVKQSAAEWIEQAKQEPFRDFDGQTYKRNLSVPARIIAARQLADAERGKKDKLGTELSEQDILSRAAELENDETFRRIMKKDDVAEEIEASRKNPRSNGGALEDILKREIRRLPPGQLPNKPAFARYMPTVKERIEILQKMAKKGSDAVKIRCAAEIMALRQINGVKRNDVKTLKMPIPTDAYSSLRAKTEALTADPVFREAARDPRVLAALQSGHGGKMAELLKAKRAELDRENEAHKTAGNVTADPYSIGGRLKELQSDARIQLPSPEKLAQMSQADKDNFRDQSKQMIAKYISLDMQCRDPKDMKKIDPEALKKFAGLPQTMYRNARSVEEDPDFEKMVNNMSEADFAEVLRDMGNKPQQEFMQTLAEKNLMPQKHREQLLPTAEKKLEEPQAALNM